MNNEDDVNATANSWKVATFVERRKKQRDIDENMK